MESKYLKYNLDELVEDKQFIAWVYRGEKDVLWTKFLDTNIEFKTKTDRARQILVLLKDSYSEMDEDSVMQIWKNLEFFESKQKQKNKKIRLWMPIRWAASILIIVSLGTLGYLYLTENNTDYEFVASEYNVDNETKITLANGKVINVDKESSTVAVRNGNELIINNDSVVDLDSKIKETSDRNRMNEVRVPYGKRSELLLADGTKVWLNAGSQLAFPTTFSGSKRVVYLEGEAYFEVTKDENSQFIVQTNDIDVEVLGTHFNVSAYPTDGYVETILLEGSVMLQSEGTFGLSKNKTVLKPFQKAYFEREENSIVVTNEPNAEYYIAWKDGWMQFERKKLDFVISKLEKYYNVKINLSGEFHEEKSLISGKMDLKDSLEEVMQVLSEVAKIEFKMKDNTVLITKTK